MITAPAPETEDERLEALRDLNILDTEPEYRFDRITRMLARSLDCQFAELNLIDEERQWSKSQFGTEEPESPREHSFCAHAILQDELLVIPDARKDDRFRNNPYVKKYPSIRFYMSTPLKDQDGYHVGTLCVFDDEPYSPTKEDRELLRLHGELAERELRDREVVDPKIKELKDIQDDLIREIDHRVRTNLQFILCFLNLENRHNADTPYRDLHPKIQGRVQTIALLHDHLEDREKNSKANPRVLLRDLADQVLQQKRLTRTVSLALDTDDTTLSRPRATTLSLIVHELLVNVLDHVPEERDELGVRLTGRMRGDTFELELTLDDTTGLPESSESLFDTTSRKLLEGFCDRFDNEIDFYTNSGNLAEVRLLAG